MGGGQRREQPERYAQYGPKFFEKFQKYLKKYVEKSIDKKH
jgi:hypothetical protein